MSLNEIIKHMEVTQLPPKPESLNEKEREYAERIFFEKELRECNPGMSEIKIRGRIAKAIATARMLYKEIYGI